MTKKEEIYNILKKFGIPVSYNNTRTITFPRIIFNHVSTRSIKLSDSRHDRVMTYQITLLSDIPLELEDDEVLTGIEDELTNAGFRTNEWWEFSSEDPDIEFVGYHYILEAKK